MKQLLLSLCLLVGFAAGVDAAVTCTTGQKQVIIHITPDTYPQETSWSLYDAATNALIDSGGVNSDTVCVASAQCLIFNIYDAFGDGMCCAYGNGSFEVKLDGTTVVSGGQFQHSLTFYFNCPPGHDCGNALTAVMDTMTAPAPETWYLFIPDSTGMYEISTCALGNACDPKIYIYDTCVGLNTDENNAGTVFYNDDGCANYQSLITAALVDGHHYYIRIGDYQTSCLGQQINWQIRFTQPITGCMDSNSCNYNPLATVSDSSCVYPPNPLCPSPDLSVDQQELENSMFMANLSVNQTNCYIGEGCLGGYGNRRLIRFTTHIRNVGDQDYYIGIPTTGNGQFVYDACHGHMHYSGYAEYIVYDAANQPLQTGFKNGFCVMDLECSGGGVGKFGCNNMGITAGCGDIYNAGLDCQWIDVTDLDTGNYTLVVRVNWDHSPDMLGHYERTYNNNWAQVCFNLYYDVGGFKVFSVLPNCVPYVDCAGDTFGSAIIDCASVCNGSNVRGDVDANITADSLDVSLYLDSLKEETLNYSPCLDLNGDAQMTITDAARLNACLRSQAGTHSHPPGYQNTHKHCEFPFNIFNPFDSIIFSIADTDLVHHHFDISVFNPTCQMLAYELKLHGVTVDSVKNLAVGNYSPVIRSSASGHIVGISEDEVALFKQLAPLNFLRVYFSEITDTQICISEVIAAVNVNYEEVRALIGTECVQIPQADTNHVITAVETVSNNKLQVIPNPSTGAFELYLENKSLEGAQIEIFNELGQSIYRRVSNELTNHYAIEINDQKRGIYIVEIKLHGTKYIKRLVLM